MGSLLVRSRILTGIIVAVFALASSLLLLATSHAAQLSGEFALELSPSPLVATVKPGVESSIDLKIHNIGTKSEDLKIAARAFTIDAKSGTLSIKDTVPAEISQWVTFAKPTFTVAQGQWFTQSVKISLPKDTGFSYSFALVISRANEQQTTSGGRVVNGAVADFTLINVDKPGAKRQLEISGLATDQQVYEYLPAKINVKFKNTGNTIVQPAGNVFVQRNSKDVDPIATLPVNAGAGYILPGIERQITTNWDDGFPIFKTSTADDGSVGTNLSIDWSKLASFRFGQYTAKVVAVYNDGQRDVPIEREITFWVIPYRTIALLVIILIILIVLINRMNNARTNKAVKKAIARHEKQSKKSS